MSARRHRGYFDTNYDRNTPVATYLREREKVNVVFFDDYQYPDPSAASCKYCHEQLILVDNGNNLMCQGCGIRKPTVATSASASTITTSTSTSNDNNSSVGNDNKDKPTLPKESKSSKIKQKDSLENKSFVITQTQDTRKRRSSFEETETEDDLGALNYFSRLYGNVGDY